MAQFVALLRNLGCSRCHPVYSFISSVTSMKLAFCSVEATAFSDSEINRWGQFLHGGNMHPHQMANQRNSQLHEDKWHKEKLDAPLSCLCLHFIYCSCLKALPYDPTLSELIQGHSKVEVLELGLSIHLLWTLPLKHFLFHSQHGMWYMRGIRRSVRPWLDFILWV